MGTKIEVGPNITREELDKAMAKNFKKKKKINLAKYFGKVNFGGDGLKYQKKIRSEWR